MARQDFRFQRGDHVRDLITGFSGVVISRADSITGCDRFCVQPQDLDNGKMIGWWVLLDEDNKPFLTVRTHPWALLMVELINNRGSEPEDE
jgi:hypothetical protein